MSKSKKDIVNVEVEGIAMYASVHEPKKGFNDSDIPSYQVKLVVDKKNQKLLEEAGLKPAKTILDKETEAKTDLKFEEYPGLKVFSLRRKIKKADGTSSSALQVVDAELNPIPATTLIGNGSKIAVSLITYPTQFKRGHTMTGVQVLDLVPYESPTLFKKKSGYVLKSHGKTVMEADVKESSESPFEGEF